MQNMQKALDAFELDMLHGPVPVIDLPLVHRFTPGMYIREIHMPAGTLATSKTHKVRHPYTILSGSVSVFIPGNSDLIHIDAPFFGITEAGTRRLLYVHSDCVWITFHPNPGNLTDLDEIERMLIERRELPDGTRIYDHYITALSRTVLVEEGVR